jgi:hypothetical protein
MFGLLFNQILILDTFVLLASFQINLNYSERKSRFQAITDLAN